SLASPGTEAVERTLSQLEEELAALASRRAAVMTELESRRDTIARLEEQWQTQSRTVAQMHAEREREQAELAELETREPATTYARRAAREARARRADARVIAAELDAQALPPRIERLQLLIRQQDIEARWLTALLREAETSFAERSTEELR